MGVNWAHLCHFCGWHRAASSATMLDPVCESCGGTLRAVEADDLERVRLEDAEVPHVAGVSRDATGIFAALVSLPWFLPLLGVDLGDVVFVVPVVLLSFAAHRALAASRREPEWRWAWLALVVATATAAAASVFAVFSAVWGDGVGDAVFQAALSSSVALLLATAAIAVRALAGVGWERTVDAALLCLVAIALTVYFVVVPGVETGDVTLTTIVVVDLCAFGLVALSAVAQGGRRRRAGAWWVMGAIGAVVVGDSLVAATAAGDMAASPGLTAVLWAVAGYCIASGAETGFSGRRGRSRAPAQASDQATRGWVMLRVVLPLVAVLSFPVVAVWLSLRDGLPDWGWAYFGAFFVSALILAFGRQALLLVEHQRNIVRERGLRREATQRNEELEALTGLATTMTQTLEEAPIVEQALGVLASAASATSGALMTAGPGGAMQLTAATGAWHAERTWAAAIPGEDGRTTVVTRGGRSILRVPLAARGHAIGTVTLVRPAAQPFDERGVALLRLLVDQMAVAVQNARDYREKLEQAIRDPLTGLYNRRFLLETLRKEAERAARYGSEASLVIFDVDDFKDINDTFGHAAGDEVLRRIGQVVTGLIRPVDSFARIGGEEFALLMPETPQMDALLVAERVRTSIGREKIVESRRITISGGLASCPGDTMDPEELQQKADAALYWAKRNGKDLCAVASEISVEEGESVSDRRIAQLYALVAMIDETHLHTRDHSENVASYALALGQELGLERTEIARLRRAAMLHDIGKVGVASAVLDKPGPLDDEEFAQIRSHPEVGGRILSHAGLREEAAWVRAHHERFDGRGYPDGLAGGDIPFQARIIFVADSLEAMTSDRPYQAGRTVAEAVAELRACAGTQFDPAVVDAVERLVREERLTVMALRKGTAVRS